MAWGHGDGVGVVVMAWGCGDIPFLADGNYGVMGFGYAMEFLLTLKRRFTFYDNFPLSICTDAVNPHSVTWYR